MEVGNGDTVGGNAHCEEGNAHCEEGNTDGEEGITHCEEGIADCEEGNTDCEEGIADCEEGITHCEEGNADCEEGNEDWEECFAPCDEKNGGQEKHFASIEIAFFFADIDFEKMVVNIMYSVIIFSSYNNSNTNYERYIMPTSDYLPRNEEDYNQFLHTFADKLRLYNTELNVSNEKIDQLTTESAAIAAAILESDSAEQTYRSKVAQKQEMVRASKDGVRRLVNQIKAHDAFTQAIGLDLNVFGTPVVMTPEEINNAKPEVEATITEGFIILDWKKKKFDGVAIYRKIDAATAFTFLDKDTKSPYEDAIGSTGEGAPQIRTYKFIYLLEDKEVGQASDEIRVVAG